MRHREAWAVEKKAPSPEQWGKQQEAESSSKVVAAAAAPARRTVGVSSDNTSDDLPTDVLVVVSKLKKYVKLRADMKTSETVIPALSDELRRICDRAIRIAGQDGRKTIMDRDIREALKQR